jgi:hypothetical protein
MDLLSGCRDLMSGYNGLERSDIDLEGIDSDLM